MPILSRRRRLAFATLLFSPACALMMAAESAPSQDRSPAALSSLGDQVRFPVEKYVLANGLTVLLQEDHSAPLISYQTWFRVGSKLEEAGFTGIAHLFEHMMFTGAKRYTGPQFDALLQSNGARNNAGTTHDYTFYYETLPAGKLELAIDLDSDRMENLHVNDANLRSERDVVKEERRYRVDNSPMGLLNEAVFGLVFRTSPYHWPVVGYMADIDAITTEKAQDFFRTYYAPNNAVVVVAGDFKVDQAKALIEKYYGSIPRHEVPAKAPRRDARQTAARSQVLLKDVQSTTFSMAFHAAQDGVDDAYALDLLANVLGRGPSSRLHRRLVYVDQLASSAVAVNETLQDEGLFNLVVSMKPGADVWKAERAVQGELWRARNRLVTADELTAARTHALKSYVDSLKTVQGRAEALGSTEVVHGDYRELFRTWDRYSNVTAEQLRKAAQKYLEPGRSTLVVLRPALRGASR